MIPVSKDNLLMFLFIAVLAFPYFLFFFVSDGLYRTIVIVYGLWQTSMLVVFIKREVEKFGDKAGEMYKIWGNKK